ncbi:hypothetical protein CSOJ01_11455 [Colletotrichum sojae]|uniref:Clr5 domain-containing protein n=1 Tax=Colletotrichum sojae TaxID=2175907 RepID=A0A8H6MN29_9PEZI|nr:hypothetical protein CSOJ01_11455 [Colletotrichum sojae]
MDIHMLDALALAKGKTYATPEVWQCHRDTITRLYQREKKTLKEVKEIMERDYWFYASERMFRTRINKWGLDKKLKEDDVLEMLRLKRQHDVIGKRSHFTIRHQDVEWDRVVEYLRRRPDLEKRIRAADATRSKISDLICRTPSPVPQLLQPASETRVQEDILRLLRDHINGCVEGRMWIVSRYGQTIYGHVEINGLARVRIWFRGLTIARHLLAAHRPNAAFSVLNRGLSSVKRLIRENDPRFLCITVERLLRLPNDVRQSIIVFISRMHRVVLGHQHPMSLIWGHLEEINNSTWSNFDDKLIECSKSCFGVYFSLGDPMVLWHHIMHAQRSQRRRYGDGGAESKPVLDYLQNDVASIITDDHPDRIYRMLSFGRWQMAAGEQEAAQKTLTQAGLLIDQRPPQCDKGWWKLQAKYYDCMGGLSHSTGNYEESVRYGLRAYEMRKKIHGARSSEALRMASIIARDYEAIGNHEEVSIWIGVLGESITDDFFNMTLGTAT